MQELAFLFMINLSNVKVAPVNRNYLNTLMKCEMKNFTVRSYLKPGKNKTDKYLDRPVIRDRKAN